MKARVYIETSKFHSNECQFIRQYTEHLLHMDFADSGMEVLCVGGKDRLCKFDNQMRECTMLGGCNLVIFDCDSAISNGGHAKRTEELEKLRMDIGTDFDFFLFPNNEDDGAFEDILLHIINPKHKGIIECFNQYERCVGGAK